ncbi:MAG: hypothetical protein LC649_06220 [Bacteroidales bacterium]|nr:hypothetical protein [Bacteroidales bacterium]
MKNLRIFILIAFCSAFIPLQDNNAQVYKMDVDHVKPSMNNEYQAALKEYVDFLTTGDFAFPLEVYRSRDLHYYVISQIKPSYIYLDSIVMSLGDMGEKDPEGWTEMFSKFYGTYNTSRDMCYYFASNLSWLPEEPAVAYEDLVCMEVWFVQVTLGKAKDLNRLLTEYNSLRKEKEVPYPLYVYRGLIGMDQGTYMLVNPGLNPADIWNSGIKAYEMLGKEGERLNKQMMKLLDNIEVKYLWYLKDFSYKPQDK